jgi:tetratricopeptide (TPR) repeat protein
VFFFQGWDGETEAVDIKSLFKGKKARQARPAPEDPDAGREHTLEDLIVLERFEEARDRLKERLKKRPEDLHSHLKLAEVYTGLRRGEDAVQEYVFVAEEYARDGFYEKGIALLGKASRLAPLDERVRQKTEALNNAKRLEHKRTAAVEGLRQGGAAGNAWAMEVQRDWHHLARGPLIQGLPAEQLQRLFGALVLTRWGKGSMVAERGSTGEELHLVLRGTLEARLEQDGEEADGDGASRELRTFGPGDIVGETVLFERRPWPATYVATEPTALLTLPRLGLEKALLGNPDPRGLLESLRKQAHDQAVVNLVGRLKAG